MALQLFYMYLLLLSLLGASCDACGVGVKENAELASRYLLPKDTTPSFYDVRLFLDPGNERYFYGNVTITITANTKAKVITMHALGMTLDSIKVFSESEPEENLFEHYTLATDDTQFLKIFLTTEMVEQKQYHVHIDYTATFSNNMVGVYMSKYEHDGKNMSLITSHMQPTYARSAFPCYDEPALKAIFRTTIYAPPAYPIVRSNMPGRADTKKNEVEGFVKFEFQDTLMMSTYITAYLVSNFDYIDNTANRIYKVPFRIFSRPGTQRSAEFALDFGQRNMVALQRYIEFPYALPKFDKAAVPQFGAGAMENWGLVLYRELALLVTNGVTTTLMKQNVGSTTCHENIHQWFGNEVSPKSWTYTWLNEGFATFFESLGTDMVLPEWRMMDQFVTNLQFIFQMDAVLSTNPMDNPVYTPAEIAANFNYVSYKKAGCVIRMLYYILTPELFRRGLVRYIKDNTRKVVEPKDLYKALEAEMVDSGVSFPASLSTIMTSWTSQGGFPVITVKKTSSDADSVLIEQERYLTDGSQSANDHWYIPINWVLSTNMDFSDTKPQAWVGFANSTIPIEIPGLSQAEWYIINKQETGFYRVNYEVSNWRALGVQLGKNHEAIHVLNRAQILDDAFNLASTEKLDYEYVFEISRYLTKEKDYIPWAAANQALTYLDIMLEGKPEQEAFKKFLVYITEPLFNSLGFKVVEGEDYLTGLLRPIILDLHCKYANEKCINKSEELLNDLKNDPSASINPDVKSVVLCFGVRRGDRENFMFLWNRYLNSTSASEKSIILSALGCTSNRELRELYLEQVTEYASPLDEDEMETVLLSVIKSSPENAEAALDFIMSHYGVIRDRFKDLNGLTDIINAFEKRLTTRAQLRKINSFISKRNEQALSVGELSSISGIKENIVASINWSEKNAAAVKAWLEANYGVKSTN